MPVIDLVTDAENLTLTIRAEFDAPADRVWCAYTDPRQLERFWGPPGWPATFTAFDLRAGGRARYRMTSPAGDTSAGAWEFVRIEESSVLEVLDFFVDEDGSPLEGFEPMRMVMSFEELGDRTRMTSVTFFASLESLEQGLAMGMLEGTRSAMEQIDAVLEDLRDFSADRGTVTEILDDTHVRITRLVRGPRELVWRAYTEPELLRRWMLGPDGWVMNECVFRPEAGAAARYSWEPDGVEGEPFGFEGEVLQADAPRRLVSTERMIGVEGPSTTNDLQLYEEEGLTLLTFVIEYPDKDLRDMILGTGMVEGMEASFARLEGVIAENPSL